MPFKAKLASLLRLDIQHRLSLMRTKAGKTLKQAKLQYKRVFQSVGTRLSNVPPNRLRKFLGNYLQRNFQLNELSTIQDHSSCRKLLAHIELWEQPHLWLQLRKRRDWFNLNQPSQAGHETENRSSSPTIDNQRTMRPIITLSNKRWNTPSDKTLEYYQGLRK